MNINLDSNGEPIYFYGNSYYIIVDGYEWTTARSNAQNLGGDLVVINDNNENDFLADNFRSQVVIEDFRDGPRGGAWIGLNQNTNRSDRAWVDGTDISGYSNYGPDQDKATVPSHFGYLLLLRASGSDYDTWWTEPVDPINFYSINSDAWAYRYGIAEVDITNSANILLLGEENDNISGLDNDDSINGGEGDDTLDGGNGNDQLLGGSGNDRLIGSSGADTLIGGSGNDTLNGGLGDDSMLGGAGNDIYFVDSTSDSVTERSSKGTDTIQSSVTWSLADNFENITLTGTEDIDATGNNAANTIRGNSGANTLKSAGGRDILYGNGGNDILNGGTGVDNMRGGAGDDTYIVDNSNDVIKEASNKGTDLVQASVHWTLANNFENLTLTGSSNLIGDGNAFANTIRGNSGRNLLYGAEGDDLLYGNAARDVLIGEEGNDKLFGGTGNDYLLGDEGDDKLTGGEGNDRLSGGDGNDIFKINTGTGRDVITDYTSREDRIKLLGGITENDLSFSYKEGHTRIKDDEGDLLAIVQNTVAADITFI